jgi:hypothetical protein
MTCLETRVGVAPPRSDMPASPPPRLIMVLACFRPRRGPGLARTPGHRIARRGGGA